MRIKHFNSNEVLFFVLLYDLAMVHIQTMKEDSAHGVFMKWIFMRIKCSAICSLLYSLGHYILFLDAI